MIEYQGWATIREAYREQDEDEAQFAIIAQQLDVRVKQLRTETSSSCYLEVKNVSLRLVVFGNRNHRSGEWQHVLGLFEWIAENAPGSYGCLSVHDDEKIGEENDIVPYILKKGVLTKCRDVHFAPFFFEVEEI